MPVSASVMFSRASLRLDSSKAEVRWATTDSRFSVSFSEVNKAWLKRIDNT